MGSRLFSTNAPLRNAQQAEFFDPFEARVLPKSGRSFWTLNIKTPDGLLRQHPYRLSDLDWVLRNINPNLDTYMSQAFFDRPLRRALHVSWLTHAYVDLDIYRLPVRLNPHHAPHWVRQHCRDNCIPVPSLIIFLVLAAVLGLIAATWPARRAARLDVLAAIAAQ